MLRSICIEQVIRWWIGLFHHFPTLTVSIRTSTQTWWYCFTKTPNSNSRSRKHTQVEHQLLGQSITYVCTLQFKPIYVEHMRQTLLIVNLYVPRPYEMKARVMKKKKINMTAFNRLLLCPNEFEESSIFAVCFLRGSPKWIATQKLVVLVKLQATKSSQLFVEKGPLVASAIERWQCNYNASWWTPYEVRTQYTEIHLFTKQNCFTCLLSNKTTSDHLQLPGPACSHQTISL